MVIDHLVLLQGMNAAVRAVVRMGLFLGCKVYLIKEVDIFISVVVSYMVIGTR